MSKPKTASINKEQEVNEAVVLNFWTLNLTPPARKEQPKTRSMFESTEPRSDA